MGICLSNAVSQLDDAAAFVNRPCVEVRNNVSSTTPMNPENRLLPVIRDSNRGEPDTGEPTGNPDENTAAGIMEIFQELAREQASDC